MQNIFIDVLPPWVETGLQPAFYDLESGTVLQQTARMWAKMREMGVAFNTFTTDVTETVNKFIDEFHELYTYVHDYFDNLDVQEEINNKLDAMAEDGTLGELLEFYNESYCVQGVTVSTHYYNATNTEYVIAEIPAKNKKDEDNLVRVGIAKDYYSSPQVAETVRDFSKRHNTTIATNGGYNNVDPDSPIYLKPDGVVIVNGEVLVDNTVHMSEQRQHLWYFAIDSDNKLRTFEPVTPAQDMIDAGVQFAVLGEVPLVLDGENFHTTHPDVTSGSGWTTPYNHTVWGQKANGDFVVFACSGKGNPDNQGIALTDIADILINDYGVEIAIGLDPGGSAQMTYKDYLMIKPGEDNWTSEREIATTVYVGKELETLTDYQIAESATNKILSDIKYEADNKYVFDNGYITLKNFKNNINFSGIDCYQNDKRTKLYWRTNSLDYTRYNSDNTYDMDIFNANANGYLTTSLGELAHIPSILPIVDTNENPDEDINDLEKVTFRYCPPTTNEYANGNEPYSDCYSIVFNLSTKTSTYREQLAIPVGTGSETHQPVRRYRGSDGTWSNWSIYNSQYYTDWTALTSTKGTFEYRRQGNIVNIRGTITHNNTGSLTTIPVAIRPTTTVTTVVLGGGNNMAKAYVLNNGTVGVGTLPSSEDDYTLNVTYMLG